jgi:hypothetical protein
MLEANTCQARKPILIGHLISRVWTFLGPVTVEVQVCVLKSCPSLILQAAENDRLDVQYNY